MQLPQPKHDLYNNKLFNNIQMNIRNQMIRGDLGKTQVSQLVD
jgi:hypothetical protein